MQTWLPYPTFAKSAEVLDNARLGAQRNEALIALRTLHGEFYEKNGWANHPTVKMWKGYEWRLRGYLGTICLEGMDRSDSDVWREVMFEDLPEISKDIEIDHSRPDWFGVQKFHDSHKARLLHKEPEHYSQFDWDVEPDPEIFWPTKNGYGGSK